ncbi:MAG: RecX family transcriptional regulator [Lachnospiraceae bacterium]|nr:RecX family transcriptional regulator [Lachnospiraceae bacterium]
MLTISEIREFSKAKNMILFDDESFLTVYKGMYKGSEEEMTEEELEELTKEMISYGKKRAMNLLLKKDYSRRALEKKLEEDGYNPGIIENIFSFLDSFHYLDDDRLAENLIRSYRSSKSRAEIRFLLKKRELTDEVIERAIENVYSGENEEEEENTELKAVVNLLKKINMTPEKIAGLDFKEKQKLAAKFYRKGFKAENISKALKMESFD